MTAGEIRALLEGRDNLDPIHFVVVTDSECCPGHIHENTELHSGVIEATTYGTPTITLTDLS